jgi:lipopolysaccharide export system protein LptA
VRLSIERMRTLVLVAGLLLLAALVVFLAIGKWKNPFNRRDIPQRLGLDIKSDSSGYTFEHAFGAHARYKIHAAKVLEYKQGYAKLHDVTIEMYGDDGRSIDRIEGSDFEYDQKAGTARADGPVEITLERPGAVTSLAPKAAPALDPKLKGTPVAAAAETAARGEIHVKTSGLTFDRNTGVATTAAHVDFSMVQGSGSSMGATFDSQQGFVVLDRAVELTTKHGAATVVIHAQHAEFERSTQLCRLHTAAANFAQDGDFNAKQATAGDAKILFRDDGSAVRLDALNGFTLATATGSHLAAPTGHLDFDEHNQPRHGHLEGGVTMDSASQKGSDSRQMRGSAPTAELEFTTRGQLRHAHLERGVELHSNELSVRAGQPQRLSRTWRSPVADVDFRLNAHGQPEPALIHGTGGVVLTGESQRGKGAVAPSRLAADQMTGEFAPGSVLTAMNGVGHTSFEETTDAGVHQSTSGDRLEAHFAPAATAKPAKGSPEAAAQVQSAIVEGHVVLVQIPAPSPRTGLQPQPMRATAGRADYAGSGQWLHLTLNPRVEDRGMQLTADKVDVSQATGEAFAHGNVKASYLGSDAAHPGQGGASLGAQGPVHVVSAEAQVHQTTQEATFRGQAHLWQQGNSISAPVIVLDHVRQSLAAHTTSAAEPVRAVLVSAPASPSQNASKKPAAPSVIRLRGGDLKYSDLDRKALMRAGLLGSVTAESGTATSTSSEVEVVLLPVGHHVSQEAASAQAQVDHVTARGHVVLTSEGRRGVGEQLVYTAATGEYVLTGTATELPRMTDPARGLVTGEAIIFRSRDDSINVEGGSQKTRTQTTAPKR